MALGQAGGDVIIGGLIKYGNFPTNFSDCGNKRRGDIVYIIR